MIRIQDSGYQDTAITLSCSLDMINTKISAIQLFDASLRIVKRHSRDT